MYIESKHFVLVDPARSLQELIEAGRYDWVDPIFREGNFPLFGKRGKGEERRRVKLATFRFSPVEVPTEMIIRGYQPSCLGQLLAFGEAVDFKGWPVVAFDSAVIFPESLLEFDEEIKRSKTVLAPAIWCFGGQRELGLVLIHRVSPNYPKYRFLAFKEREFF